MGTKIKSPKGAAVGIIGGAVLCACGTNVGTTAGTNTSTNTTTTVTTPTGSTSDSSTTTTTATGTPADGWVVSPNGIKGEFDVADNFDVQATLFADGTPVPPEADPVGAFRFECLAGQLAKDDPIVYPGQPGKSHLHQFFGNTLTNASSNYQSLRTSGSTTCTGGAGNNPTSQRSAYWMPAMLDGGGNAVKPNRMLTYYKRLPAGNPECGAAPDATHIGFCVPIPNGLRMITGYNMATGKGGPADMSSSDQYTMYFDCWGSNGTNTTPVEHTMAAVIATGACPVGSQLRARIDFPECWDGKNLDSPDHRSHVVVGSGPGGLASGFRQCPADHPYRIPQISMQAFYTVDANFVAGKWHLSSDEMMAGTVAGTTLHADYWEAWSPVVKNLWETGCLNGHLSCNNGQLANGQTIQGMQQTAPWPDHVLVALGAIQ